MATGQDIMRMIDHQNAQVIKSEFSFQTSRQIHVLLMQVSFLDHQRIDDLFSSSNRDAK